MVDMLDVYCVCATWPSTDEAMLAAAYEGMCPKHAWLWAMMNDNSQKLAGNHTFNLFELIPSYLWGKIMLLIWTPKQEIKK